MRVLGFSVGHHKGAVIIEDGKVIVGISQERLTRIKSDGAYSGGKIPFESINYCLNYLNLTYEDIDYYVYSTTELIDDVEEQFFGVYTQLKTDILHFIPHHLAHAYSSFMSSGFEESAVVVADASGSILNYKNKLHKWYENSDKKDLDNTEDYHEGFSIYHFTKNEYKEVYKKWVKELWVDNSESLKSEDLDSTSLGFFYGIGCQQLIYSTETHTWPAGKLMGLASFADQEFLNNVPPHIIEKAGDIYIPNKTIYPRVTWQSDFFSRARVAGIYQREQETGALILAKKAKEITGSNNLCVAGGSFLNCNANKIILNSGLFENCFFIPPSDDSGIPLGCSWYAYQQLVDINHTEPLKPYIGKVYSKSDIVSSLNEFTQLKFKEYQNFDELINDITFQITENRVIGWFQDGSEIGPRALGNRSILASPIKPWMKDHINNDIKKREWYRPFAPAVLFEHQNEIFESEIYSPYMLLTTTVREEWRNKIPSVTHIDNSARHQSVTLNNNPKFYNLIKRFYEMTGVPVLLNTSFNGPNEPIVESPKDAILTFLNNNLDYLVINNFIISR